MSRMDMIQIESLESEIEDLEAENAKLWRLTEQDAITIAELQSMIEGLQAENKKLRKIIALSENNLEPERKWIKPRQKHWNTK